ncbi:helix-turn-helix transcriptional regulator [Streptomyces buecherae]|uniref:helix-turn-helix transcriptional regulator n=1 Tax=Streptomyces buecherae TaxID=2763006 RepID=UPI0036B10BA6
MPTTSSRLLALLSLLQARRDWPGADLAARLDVHVRTIRRDVDRLRELGYPIVATKGPDGGYRLDAGSRLPPLLFDDDQAVALAVALQSTAASAAAGGGAGSGHGLGADIGEAAARALHTVRDLMPARLRHRIDTLRATVVAPPRTPAEQPDGRVLATLAEAVRAREELRFDYAPPPTPPRDDLDDRADDPPPARDAATSPRARDAATSPRARDAATPSRARDAATPPPGREATRVRRRVQPHHLVTWGGRWYLLAWDLDRADWRTFRADRVTPRVPTGPRFTPRALPGGDVAVFVAGRFRGADGPGDWPCRGEVVLDLPAADVARHAFDGLVEEWGPDRCRLVLGSWSWTGLACAIGRFDADFEVVGPPELRSAFARLARRAAGAAAGEGPSPQARHLPRPCPEDRFGGG